MYLIGTDGVIRPADCAGEAYSSNDVLAGTAGVYCATGLNPNPFVSVSELIIKSEVKVGGVKIGLDPVK